MRGVRSAHLIGWLFVAPALLMYAAFVLLPLALTFQYSLYRWDGIGPSQWVGLDNYVTVLTDPDLVGVILNAFKLIVFFSLIPVGLGLSSRRSCAGSPTGRFGTVVPNGPVPAADHPAGRRRHRLELGAVSTSGLVNQVLSAIGLDGVTRAWLGDFDSALPAVGMIGAWVLIGLCTILLLTGMSKIDPALYESARLDGAGPSRSSARSRCRACARRSASASRSRSSPPWRASTSSTSPPEAVRASRPTVPGLEIYQLAFAGRQVGLASALAVVLFILVLACVLPIQRLARGDEAMIVARTRDPAPAGCSAPGTHRGHAAAVPQPAVGRAAAVGLDAARDRVAVGSAMGQLRRRVQRGADARAAPLERPHRRSASSRSRSSSRRWPASPSATCASPGGRLALPALPARASPCRSRASSRRSTTWSGASASSTPGGPSSCRSSGCSCRSPCSGCGRTSSTCRASSRRRPGSTAPTTWDLFWRIHVPLAQPADLVARDPAVRLDLEPVPAGPRARRGPTAADDGRCARCVPGPLRHQHPAALRRIAADPDPDPDRLPAVPAPVHLGAPSGLSEGLSPMSSAIRRPPRYAADAALRS